MINNSLFLMATKLVCLVAPMVLSIGCAGPHVVTDGSYDLRASPDEVAFSDDSRCVAFSIRQHADAATRLYWGQKGLFSGWSGRPFVGLRATTRKRFSICWAKVSAPQIVHKIELPELTLDSTTSLWDGVRGLAFSPDGTRLAALDAQRLSVIDLADGHTVFWRGTNLSRFVWVGFDRLAVLSCEGNTNASVNECLAVTYHIDLGKGGLRGRRVRQQITQQFDKTPGQTAFYVRVNWSKEGLPDRIGSSVYGSKVFMPAPEIIEPPAGATDSDRLIFLWPTPAPPRMAGISLRLERVISRNGRWLCSTADLPDQKAHAVILVDLEKIPKHD